MANFNPEHKAVLDDLLLGLPQVRAGRMVNDGLLGATVVYSIAVDKDSNVYATTPNGIFQLERK